VLQKVNNGGDGKDVVAMLGLFCIFYVGFIGIMASKSLL
jgi:hypothetical protein